MKNRRQTRQKDNVDAAVHAVNECPVPKQVEGLDWTGLIHRLRENAAFKEHRMSHWKFIIPRTRWGRALAAAGAVLLVAAIGWGAKRVIKTFTFQEEGTSEKLITSDGKTIVHGTSHAWAITSDDPDFTEEQAKERHEQIDQAIRNGKVKLLRTEEGRLGTTYIYECTLANGETEMIATGNRLLLDPKAQEKLSKELKRAMVERKGEVVAVKKLESGLTLYTYTVALSDGSVWTYTSNLPPREQDE